MLRRIPNKSLVLVVVQQVKRASTLVAGKRRRMTDNNNNVARIWDSCIVNRYGENDAIQVLEKEDDKRSYTHGQVEVMTRRIAGKLQQLGVVRNTVVGICIPQDPLACVLVEIAVWRAGGTICPVDAFNDPRAGQMLREANVELVVADEASYGVLGQMDIPAPSQRKIIQTSHLLNEEDNPTTLPTVPCSTDISHVIFTSGSTGIPKGIVVNHSSLLYFAQAKIERSRITPQSRIFVASSFTFDPWLGDIAVALVSGACLILAPRQRILAGALPHLLATSHSTHCCTTPSTWALATSSMNNNALHDMYSLLASSGLQELALGGERMPPDLAQVAWTYWHSPVAPRLINTYGVTECCVYQSTMQITKAGDEAKLGVPYRGVNIHVVTPGVAQGEFLTAAPGNEGEIVLTGPFLGLKYTPGCGKTLVHDISIDGSPPCPAYLTGDICIDGRIVGRRDTQFKIAGVRIEAGEIETCIVTNSAGLVHAVMVEFLHEQLIAIVRLSDAANGETGEFTQRVLEYICTKFLPRVYVPSRIVFWPGGDFPVTQNGKIDRKAVRDWVMSLPSLSSSVMSGDASSPLSPNERVVATVWSETLGRTITSPYDSFVYLGGDSLQALRVVNKLLSSLPPQQQQLPIVQRAMDQARSFGEVDGVFSAARLLASPSLRGYVAGFGFDLFAATAPATAPLDHDSMTKRSRADDDVDDAVPNEDEMITAATVTNNVVQDVLVKLLHDAARTGAVGTARLLIQGLGVSADGSFVRRTHFCRTPLHEAASQGNVDMVQLLLSCGAHPMPVTESRICPFHLAAMSNSPQAILTLQELMKASAQLRNSPKFNPLHVQDLNQQTVFFYAARAGRCDVMEWLITETHRLGLPVYKFVNDFDRWKRSPLHWAVVNLHVDMIKLLRREGALVHPIGLNPGKLPASTHMVQETVLELAIRRHAPGEVLDLLR